MWNPAEHSENENMLWALLRSMEWRDWPLFIGQPVVPILLCVNPSAWWVLPTIVITLTLVWRIFVVPLWISPQLVSAGPIFVLLKFITAPVAAGWIVWHQAHSWPIAVEALLWPSVGMLISQKILMVPMAIISMTPLDQNAQLGVVQMRILRAIGFQKIVNLE